jgi:hypothetical protein
MSSDEENSKRGVTLGPRHAKQEDAKYNEEPVIPNHDDEEDYLSKFGSFQRKCHQASSRIR